MDTIVPDASIILKWVMAGEDKNEEQKSLTLLNDWLAEKCRIILPSLWIYEVGNVIGLKRPGQASEILDIFLDYNFDEAPITKKLTTLTLALMGELKVTFYDAIYHSLAIIHKGTFITADKRYFNKAVGKGYVEMLSNRRDA